MTARYVCDDCRRPLRDPASIARGYGPTCWSRRCPTAGHTNGRTPGAPDVRPASGPGQTAIRLPPHQPPLPGVPRGPYPADRVWRGRTIRNVPTGDLT